MKMYADKKRRDVVRGRRISIFKSKTLLDEVCSKEHY